MICEECGSSSVSLEVGPAGIGGLSTQVMRMEQGSSIQVVRACWTCGWRETRTIVIESIRIDPGDESVATRERLLDELVEVASTLSAAELKETVDSLGGVSEVDG